LLLLSLLCGIYIFLFPQKNSLPQFCDGLFLCLYSEIMELIEHDDYFKQFANLYKLMTEVQKGIFLSYVITTLKKAGVNTVPYIGY